MNLLQMNNAMAGGAGLQQIIVDVIDSGIDASNPILSGRVKTVPFMGESVGDAGTSGSLGSPKRYYDYADYGGHGTSVACVIGAIARNAYFHSYCAVPYERATGEQSVAAYVNEALEHIIKQAKTDGKRHIVNMSLSGVGAVDDAYYARMHAAIKQLVAMNVPVIVAAGNDGGARLDKYPACFAEPVTVSALAEDGLDNGGKLAPFSTWSNEVDFAELGVNIPAYDQHGARCLFSGTSAATPVVVGKYVLAMGKYPKITDAELYACFKQCVMDLGAAGRDAKFGWGWIKTVELPYKAGGAGSAGSAGKGSPGDDTSGGAPSGTVSASTLAEELVIWAGGEVGAAYVWGAQGQIIRGGRVYKDNRLIKSDWRAWVRSMDETLDNAERSIEFIEALLAKGVSEIACYDCGGLLVRWLYEVKGLLTRDYSSNDLYGICVKISKSDLRVGDLLFKISSKTGKVNHVGLYAGNDDVIEAKGRDVGVVKTKLSADAGWRLFGRLPQLNTAADLRWVVRRVLKLLSPMMVGADVKELQRRIIAEGHKIVIVDGLPKTVGADGKFGEITEKAVRNYQKANGLLVDGKAGEKTIEALGGVFDED